MSVTSKCTGRTIFRLYHDRTVHDARPLCDVANFQTQEVRAAEVTIRARRIRKKSYSKTGL
jgi:hypothetical protein